MDNIDKDIGLNIYFAHSMIDYDTEWENIWINEIKECWIGCNVINPKDYNYKINQNNKKRAYKDIFFPLIDKCDIVIASPAYNHTQRGKFTFGVMKEIIYSLYNGKKVIGIMNNDLKEITDKDFKNYELLKSIYL